MREPLILSIGGGKGGVGKSVITANLAALLASRGYSVGLIDGDLRGANLHTCVGVKRPRKGLGDFLAGTYATLSEVALPTVIPNTWLISGASDILSLANPKFAQKQKIISHLKKLDADFILVDLGAGTDHQVSDFFAAFTYGLVVIDGMPTSVENAYGFLKNGLVRGLVRLFPGRSDVQDLIVSGSDPSSGSSVATIGELVAAVQKRFPVEARAMQLWLHAKKTLLAVNMVKDPEDLAVGNRFKELVRKYLQVDMLYLGYVRYSSDVRKSVRAMVPIVQSDPGNPVSQCFETLVQNLCALSGRSAPVSAAA